ncbi:hypothetical protein H4S02_007409, partial [Coemansia sp. RSA 2611]
MARLYTCFRPSVIRSHLGPILPLQRFVPILVWCSFLITKGFPSSGDKFLNLTAAE